MKKIYSILFIAFSLILFTGCEESVELPPLGSTHFSFEAESSEFGVVKGGETTSDIKIYSGFTTADRTIDVALVLSETTLDPAAYTVPTSVTIPANSNVGLLSVKISDTNLNPDGDTLTLEFLGKEGEYTGDKMTVNVSQLCPNNGIKLKISIALDGFPEETSWLLYDSNNTLVLFSSNPHVPYEGAYKGLSGTINVSECLPSGTYTLEVNDDYADGGAAYEILANGVSVYSLGGADYTGTNTAQFSI